MSYVPANLGLEECGVFRGAVEVFAVTECDVTSLGDWNPTFRDNLVVPKG